MRGFEIVKLDELKKHIEINNKEEIILPKRATKNSAGYDFYCPYNITIGKKKSVLIKSGIKAFMGEDEVLLLFIRSSLGIKKQLRLNNQVGVIDSDYYNNQDNDGHIMISLENNSDIDVVINQGDRICQGVFMKYLIANNEDEVSLERSGGIGSTL